MRAVFLDWDSVDNHDLDRSCFEQLPVEWEFFANTRAKEMSTHLQGAQIAISNKVLLDKPIINATDTLRLICVAATGTNNIDLDTAAKRDIPVCNVRTYATASVVQHVFMLILNLVRHLPDYQQALVNRKWQQSEFFCLLDYSIEELTNKTIGIVGYGELGQAVANMARQFGMQVLVAQRLQGTPATDRIPLEALLPEVDVLSLHCPYTAQTQNLIGAEEFGKMKPTAILINTARGGIVDELALLNAIKSKKLAGAGVDVLVNEPPITGNALLEANLPNLIITPHIAWASRQARQKLIEGVAMNIESFLNGQVINQVN